MVSIGPDDRVLVTGAGGFIGRALVDRLLTTGAEIYALVGRAPAGRSWDSTRVTTLVADLQNRAELRAVIHRAQPTTLFHLAWLTEPGSYLTSIPWNLESVRFGLDLLEQAIEAGCVRMVCAGSCAEYELGEGCLTEDSPLRPSSIYGAAKAALGLASVAAARQADIQLAWARIFYVYGPGEDPRRAVPRIIRGALERRPPTLVKPGQSRDFLHVRDVASALAQLADSSVHGPINVCSGSAVTLTQVWERAVRLLQPEWPLPPLDGHEGEHEPPILGDPSRLRAIGWRPEFELDAGLADTIQWMVRPSGRRSS